MAEVLKPNMSSLWASGGAKIAPTSEKVQTGWTAEIPPHQWENWVQNRQDEAIAYMFQHGIPEWDAGTEYFTGRSFVQHSGVVYRATANNTGMNPSTSPAAWASISGQSTETSAGIMRVATTPEAIAMTNDTAAITPLKLSGAFKGSNQALFSTGYQKIPGGLIFQWGGAEVPAASSLTLPLSIAFPSYGIRSIASFNGFVSTSVKSLGSAFANSSQIVLWNGDPNSALNISFLAVGV